jgi:uncharacterized membrane protein
MNSVAMHTWIAIVAIVTTTTLGDIFMANAMRHIGDVGEIFRRRGLRCVLATVFGNSGFYLGLFFMALSFFSLLFGLSWGNVSLVLPAGTSLTFLTNTITAKYFLKERIDHRRWLAAFCVCAGMALINT